MPIDNVILNKSATIERCIKRIDEEFLGHEIEFETNYTKQDSIILNLERLCQAAIDLAAYLVKTKKLGIPQESRELFQMLEKHSVISTKLSENLQAMVGFRNLAVHDYQELNLEIVKVIIKEELTSFQDFLKIALDTI